MKIKLSPQALREVRQHLIRASLARRLSRYAAECGDMLSSIRYRIEARDFLYQARRATDRDQFSQLKERTAETMRLLNDLFPEYFNQPGSSSNESAPEQVSAVAAPGAVRLRGVLVKSPASQVAEKPSRVAIRIVDFDGLRVDRTDFPRLSRHWFPFYLQSSRSSRLVN